MNILIIINLYIISASSNLLKSPIDLTRSSDINPTGWPGYQRFTFTKVLDKFDEDGSWLITTKEFCTAEHSGTHIDAPRHVVADGWTVADIPLERLFGNGVNIDISKKTNVYGNKTMLTVDDVEEWVKINGDIPWGSIVLVRFGWGKYYGDERKYVGEYGNFLFPAISPEVAEWFAAHGGIFGLGVDSASLERIRAVGNEVELKSTHKILLEKRIYGIENVDIPDTLPAKGFKLVVLPIKLKKGTGGAVRIVAVPK